MSQDNLTPEQRRAKIMAMLRELSVTPLSAAELEEIRHAAGGGFPAAFVDAMEAEIAAEAAEAAGASAVPPKAATE